MLIFVQKTFDMRVRPYRCHLSQNTLLITAGEEPAFWRQTKRIGNTNDWKQVDTALKLGPQSDDITGSDLIHKVVSVTLRLEVREGSGGCVFPNAPCNICLHGVNV
jgi:hypothetical protein